MEKRTSFKSVIWYIDDVRVWWLAIY